MKKEYIANIWNEKSKIKTMFDFLVIGKCYRAKRPVYDIRKKAIFLLLGIEQQRFDSYWPSVVLKVLYIRKIREIEFTCANVAELHDHIKKFIEVC